MSESIGAAYEALWLQAKGAKVDTGPFSGLLDADGSVLAKWNQTLGSQNMTPIANAAIGNYHYLAALARKWKEEGLFGTEMGSFGFYWYGVAEAMMVALRDASRADDHDAVDDIREALRAIWTMDAFVALPFQRRVSAVKYSNDYEIVQGTEGHSGGLWTAVAGNRNNPEKDKRTGTRDFLLRDHHGRLLSWALDTNPRNGPSYNGNSKQRSIVATIAGAERYGTSVAPEVFGLTMDERRKLSAITQSIAPSTPLLQEAIGWVKDYGILSGWKLRQRRAFVVSGVQWVETVFFGPYPNPNKPAHAYTTFSSDGHWSTMTPLPAKKKNILTSDWSVTIDERMMLTAACSGNKVSELIPSDESTIYEITYENKEVNLRVRDSSALDVSNARPHSRDVSNLRK